MKVYSRITGVLGMAVLTVLGSFSAAHAQEFPNRPVRLIVSQGAGGNTDTMARMWAEHVSKTLGQPVVVENRPGAGGVIAAQAVLGQPADGHTLFLAGVSQLVLNKFVYKPLAYVPEKDFVGVATLTNTPFLLVANPKTGFKSFDDLKAAALADPEKLNYASAGRGNSTHLVVELVQKQAGIQMSHIPFRGESDGVVATIGGSTELMAPAFNSALPHVRSGKFVPLLTLAAERSPELPDVPTAKELGMTGFDDIGWAGIAARAGTPQAAVEKLNAASNAFLDDPTVQAKLETFQMTRLKGDSGALMRFVEKDTAMWREAIGDLELSIN